MKYPTTWPGTAVIKSQHTAFNWREQPSVLPKEKQQGKRGPKKKDPLAVSPDPQQLVALERAKARNHGGAYSRAKASSSN